MVIKKIVSKLIGGSLLFYAMSGLSSLLNIAIYPLVARMVDLSAYGEIQFLLSSFNQLSVGFVVLNILAIIVSASGKNTKDKIQSLGIVAGFVGIIISSIGVLLLLFYMEQLQLTSHPAIILMGVSLLLNIPFTILVGSLQGNDRFVASGVVSLIATIAKFGLSILFVALGMGVAGAILGIAAGMTIALAVGMFYRPPTRSGGLRRSFKAHLSSLSSIKGQALAGLIVITLLTLLSTADSIISRMILSPDQAGSYAAVATIAKIILAASSPIMWLALTPAVSLNLTPVRKYITMTGLVSLLLVIIFSLAPQTILQLFMGTSTIAHGNLLTLASLSMASYALGFILSATLLCLNELKVVTLTLLSGAVAYVLFVTLISESLTMELVLYGQLCVGIAISASCWLALMRRNS